MMTYSDALLVAGLLFAAFSVPTAVSAYSDLRPPNAALTLLAIGAVLVAVAVWTQPGGYRLSDIPDVFLLVVGNILH